MTQNMCEGRVWTGLRYCPCDKIGRQEHDGKWYCKRHHPPTVAAKEAARKEKWEADWAAQKRAMEEAQAAREEVQRRAGAYDGLVAQRDALLEALKTVLAAGRGTSGRIILEAADEAAARAAIAAAEGEKK